MCQHETPPLRLINTHLENSVEYEHYAACHFAEELNLRGVIAGEQPPAP